MKRFDSRRETVAVLRLAVCFLLLSFTVGASAQTTLTGAGVRNGDFEADVTTNIQRTYAETPDWQNIGTGANQSLVATVTNIFHAGARSFALDDTGTRVAGQDTGHTIAAGDIYAISCYWRDGWQWDIAELEQDRIVVRLFTTANDAIGGAATTFATLFSGNSATASTFELAAGSAMATPSEAGKRLFVSIGVRAGDSGLTGYGNVDNFTLTVSNSSKQVQSIIHYSPALQNGGFESAVGSTAGNWGAGLNVLGCSINTNPAYTAPQGSGMLDIDAQFGSGGLQNTGHVVQDGQTFSLSFNWSSAWQWDAADSIGWRLFTTSDNTVGGTVTVIASGAAAGKDTNGTVWDTHLALHNGGTVNPANVGKKLWVEIRGIAGVAEYAKIDMVRLLVNSPRLAGTIFLFE